MLLIHIILIKILKNNEKYYRQNLGKTCCKKNEGEILVGTKEIWEKIIKRRVNVK